MGVGGVKIWELRDQIQGIGLPKHKEHLGNQWGRLLETKFKPEAITSCIGSNDVDDFELHCRKYRRHMLDPWYYDRLVNRDLQAWYLDLREHIVEIMELIVNAFTGVPILYLSILPRPWWGKHSRTLARYIDNYFLKKFDGMLLRLDLPDVYVYKREYMTKGYEYRDDVMPGLLDYDRVHLNEKGYHLLTESVLVKSGQKLYFPAYGPGKNKAKQK